MFGATGRSVFGQVRPASLSTQDTASRLPQPDARRLALGTYSITWYTVRGTDTVRSGGGVERMWIQGDTLVRVRSNQTMIMGRTVDTVMDHVPDMSPILYAMEDSNESKRVTFLPGTHYSSSVRLADGHQTSTTGTLPRRVWDLPSAVLVLAASDLRAGATFDFPVVYPGHPTAFSLHARVTTGALAGKDYLLVQLQTDGQDIGTAWIDASARQPRRFVAPASPGVVLIQDYSQAATRETR